MTTCTHVGTTPDEYTPTRYLHVPLCTHGRMATMDTTTLKISVELMKNLLREQLCNCMYACIRFHKRRDGHDMYTCTCNNFLFAHSEKKEH